MPRPQNTDERRAEIVAGLMLAMAEHGYAGATVAKIAKAAGLSPGLIHYHFQSKGEILLALVDDLALGLFARIARKSAGARTPKERLFALLDALVATGDDADARAVAAWVVVSAEALRDDEVNAAWRTATSGIIDALAAAAADVLGKKRTSKRARLIALALFSSVQGAYQLAAAAPDLLPSGSFAPLLRTMAEGLIDDARNKSEARHG